MASVETQSARWADLSDEDNSSSSSDDPRRALPDSRRDLQYQVIPDAFDQHSHFDSEEAASDKTQSANCSESELAPEKVLARSQSLKDLLDRWTELEMAMSVRSPEGEDNGATIKSVQNPDGDEWLIENTFIGDLIDPESKKKDRKRNAELPPDFKAPPPEGCHYKSDKCFYGFRDVHTTAFSECKPCGFYFSTSGNYCKTTERGGQCDYCHHPSHHGRRTLRRRQRRP